MSASVSDNDSLTFNQFNQSINIDADSDTETENSQYNVDFNILNLRENMKTFLRQNTAG